MLMLGCAPTSGEPRAPSVSAEAPTVERDLERTEAEILAAGPPAASGFVRALQALAPELGAAVVRCPARAQGRVLRVHGLPRDDVLRLGPRHMLEVDDDIPWHPLFDEVVVESEWAALLVEPEATDAWLELPDRRLHYRFPPGEAGTTRACTAVEGVPLRVVRGRVEPRAGMVAHGCTFPGTPVARDGTFVVEAAVPCTLWLESSDGWRTDAVGVAAGAAPVTVEALPWARDELLKEDRTWSTKGLTALEEIVRQASRDLPQLRATLQQVERALVDDAAGRSHLRRWRGRLVTWETEIGQIRRDLAQARTAR